MGTYTTNYNLFMPTVGETGWGTLINGNFETIDTTMKSLSNRVTTCESYGARITAIENEVNGALNCTSVTTSGKITGNGGIAGTTGTFSGAVTGASFNGENFGYTLYIMSEINARFVRVGCCGSSSIFSAEFSSRIPTIYAEDTTTTITFSARPYIVYNDNICYITNINETYGTGTYSLNAAKAQSSEITLKVNGETMLTGTTGDLGINYSKSLTRAQAEQFLKNKQTIQMTRNSSRMNVSYTRLNVNITPPSKGSVFLVKN